MCKNEIIPAAFVKTMTLFLFLVLIFSSLHSCKKENSQNGFKESLQLMKEMNKGMETFINNIKVLKKKY